MRSIIIYSEKRINDQQDEGDMMSEIKVLDCTLRDGGYCNQWRFGLQNAQKVVGALNEAGVEIIECGFLTHSMSYEPDTTRFTRIEQFADVIPKNRGRKMYVCMVNFGELDIALLPPFDGTSVEGIRLAFHKKNADEALELGRAITAKGYKLFLQAMVSMSYSDNEFLELIERANRIEPYAFYIVDSFGVMKRNDMMRFFYLVEHNLHRDIWIGYHAHNNMQLAFSNAQTLVTQPTKHRLIVDTSIYGMGRGAGNLNTELFVDYLNDSVGSSYQLKPLLKVIDEVLEGFYNTGKWGYSLSNYLSASHNCHPNYANYLDDKKTLTVENMNELFSMIAEEKRGTFDKKYIEELYLKYMSRGKVFEERLSQFRALIEKKKILVIAPGPSAELEKEKILVCASSENVVSIGINFDYPHFDTNLIFISNLRRFQNLDKKQYSKAVITTNIPCENAYLQVDYASLLNNEESVKDNAGMMLLKFLIQLGVKEIMVAGMDGYTHDNEENYAESGMKLVIRKAVLDEMNRGMERMIAAFSQETHIEFLTRPRNLRV